MTAPLLRTQRLALRGWRDGDREPFAALNAHPEVMEHFPSALDRAASDAHIDASIARFERGEPSLWAVEVRATGCFIGFIGLLAPSFDAPFTPCVEVGWRLARSAWGHGYATEGARAALGHGFGELGLDEIVSFTAVGNHRSRAVMERLGMTHDPAEDFDHPRLLAEEHGHVRRHVVYRLGRGAFTAGSSRPAASGPSHHRPG